MSSFVEERIKYLQELGEFMGSAQRSVKAAAERLGWSKSVAKNEVTTPRLMVTCPLNPGHRVPEEHFQKHFKACKWKSEGYPDDAIALPESCAVMGTKKSVVIDNELADKIIREAAVQNPTMKTGTLGAAYRPIPQTSDRLFSDFTSDERRAMYDYVISQTGAADSVKLEDLQLPFESEKKSEPKTKLELLAEERDAKRRRISHRSKKVSTNRKSHTEVMREVIQNQMHLYETWLKQDEELLVNEEEGKSESLEQTIKQECQDDEYEECDRRSRKKDCSNLSKANSEGDGEHSHSRGSSTGPSRSSYASTNRDKYDRDGRVRYTDSNYGGHDHRSRPRESEPSHNRDYYHDYRHESRDGHKSRRGKDERGYRDRDSKDRRDKYKYYERDHVGRDKHKTYRPRDRSNRRRESSLTKEDRIDKYKTPDVNNDAGSSNNDNRVGSHITRQKEDYGEKKYSQTKEFRIFEDMQRLLDAQVRAELQGEHNSSSRSLSSGNEGNAVGTSYESNPPICISQALTDNSDEGIRHKSRSHKRKKGKKSKHKRKKHSKKSKREQDTRSSNDNSSSSESSN